MKKYILLLLLATFGMQAQTLQNPTFGNLKLKNNQTSTTATKVNVQENDGTINTKPLSELANYLEFASAVNLPVTGEQGKLYLTKDNNRLYRFNGTIYQELTTDISGKEDITNKQNSLAVDGTNTKYPTVTAVNTGLALKANLASPTFTGAVTATSFINSTAPATNVLLAGGTTLSQNTAFNKNFGTTAGTVVEGGTLGSNAYNSTDYFKYETFTADANTLTDNRSAFTYAVNAPHNGTLVHFGALGYGTQINTGYNDGNSFSFRTANGDTPAWNPWRKIWHDGNFNPANYLPLTGGDISNAINFPQRVNGNTSFEDIITYGFPGQKSRIQGFNNYAANVGAGFRFITHNVYNQDVNSLILDTDGKAIFASSVAASGFFQSSDRRLKTILKRDGDVAYFKWKDGRDDKVHIGYVAQEVRRTNPNQVQKGEDKMLSVNYVEILVEKIRILEKRIEQLEKSK